MSGLSVLIAQNRNLIYSLRLWHGKPGNSPPPGTMLSSFSFSLELTDKTSRFMCRGNGCVFSSQLGLRVQPPASGLEFPPDGKPAAVSAPRSRGTGFPASRRGQETERPEPLSLAQFIFSKKQAYSKITHLVRLH